MASVHLKISAASRGEKTENFQWRERTDILCVLERAVEVGEVAAMHWQVIMNAG